MSVIIIGVMCVLANLKIILQSRYAQKLNLFEESVLFNFLMFFAATVIGLPNLIMAGACKETIIAGICSGLLSVGFQIFYILAFSCGKTTLTTVINSFSMLIPTFISLWMFDEKFGILNGVGVAVVLVSFCLNVSKDKDQKLVKKRSRWLIYLFFSFILCGFISVVQKFYTNYTPQLESASFVTISYAVASTVALVIFMASKKINKSTVKLSKKTIGSGLLAGVVLSVFQVISTYGASIIDGSILYPVYNCISSLLLTVVGVTLFKEKLTKSQFIGIMLGISGVVMLSIK